MNQKSDYNAIINHKLRKSLNGSTNCFYRHKLAFSRDISIASITSRWYLLCALATTEKRLTSKACAQAGLCSKCVPIADCGI